MRVALYWAPAPDDPLHAAGSAWLGRDAELNAPVSQPDLPGIAELTADPRGYGLHATLKPPFRLATSYPAFRRDAEAFAMATTPFELPRLSVENLDGFLALRESAPCPALHALADAAVRELDAHRAPPNEAELTRRRRARLTRQQEAMLGHWGYPYVMEQWRFHVTLTRRLTGPEMDVVRPAAEAHFATVAGLPRKVEAVCVFTQAAPGAPFLVAERLALSGRARPPGATRDASAAAVPRG